MSKTDGKKVITKSTVDALMQSFFVVLLALLFGFIAGKLVYDNKPLPIPPTQIADTMKTLENAGVDVGKKPNVTNDEDFVIAQTRKLSEALLKGDYDIVWDMGQVALRKMGYISQAQFAQGRAAMYAGKFTNIMIKSMTTERMTLETSPQPDGLLLVVNEHLFITVEERVDNGERANCGYIETMGFIYKNNKLRSIIEIKPTSHKCEVIQGSGFGI